MVIHKVVRKGEPSTVCGVISSSKNLRWEKVTCKNCLRQYKPRSK